MTKQSRSRYILCSPWDKPSELDIYNWKDNGPFIKYWIRVFQEFEKASSLGGLTFYLVWNHILMPELPSYGDDVVVVIASDEECVVPPYVNKVRFVFKTIGFYPWCGDSLREQSAASMMKCARDWTRWARHYPAVPAEEWIFSEAGAENGDAHGARAADGYAGQAV